MTNNFSIKCNICDTIIRLRWQVDEKPCPINILCPECKTAIKGQIKAVWHYGKENHEKQPFHFDLDIKNATNLDTVDPLKANHKFEISADFLINKDSNNEQYLVTPFILNQHLHRGKFHEDTERFYQFYSMWEKQWNDFKINWSLCKNKKYDLAYAKIKSQSDKDILKINEIAKHFPIQNRCTMLYHQNLMLFLFKLLDKNTLPTYSKMKDELNMLLTKEKFNKVLDLMTQDNLEKYEQKLSEQIISFIDRFPLLLPAYNASMLTDIPDDLGISTITYEDLKTFYQESYELILSYVPFIIAINNIAMRGDISNFITGTAITFEDKIHSYSSKYKLFDELLHPADNFSWIINRNLENHIRNSIGHYNTSIDPTSQEISFIDEHRGRVNLVKKTYLELSFDCIKLFSTLINILELNYYILKYKYIGVTAIEQIQQKAVAQNIINDKLQPIVNDTKVGRNDPCYCGSGIKFKKCCDKKS